MILETISPSETRNYTEIFKISSNGSDGTKWDKANGCDSVLKVILDDVPMIKLRNSHGHWSTKIWYSGTPLIRSPMGRKQSGRNSVFFFTRKGRQFFSRRPKKWPYEVAVRRGFTVLMLVIIWIGHYTRHKKKEMLYVMNLLLPASFFDVPPEAFSCTLCTFCKCTEVNTDPEAWKDASKCHHSSGQRR